MNIIQSKLGKKIATLLLLIALAWAVVFSGTPSTEATSLGAPQITVADGGGTSGPNNPG